MSDNSKSKPRESLKGSSPLITARKLVDARLEIGCFLDPGLFSDPGYTILLGLLAKDEVGEPCSLAECITLSRVPATTCLRWLALLKERKLIEVFEPKGEMKTVQLAAECRATLRTYVEHVAKELSNG